MNFKLSQSVLSLGGTALVFAALVATPAHGQYVSALVVSNALSLEPNGITVDLNNNAYIARTPAIAAS